MLRNRLYYGVKPLLHPTFRLVLRRWFTTRKLAKAKAVWPILPGSEKKPEGWPGWPNGKQFAFVLTHDVEGPLGLANCKEVMEREMALGFRSSFNFVPEGSYRTTAELRRTLVENGFEVGVHDLHHDGKLYSSRREFSERARRINEYLNQWNAVGFRAGFMLHNLEWLHELNVLYDSSTFDTDPFEPQPDGVGTIFPFWVPRSPNGNGSSVHEGRAGYVELPYTLCQDSTLFLLLKETQPDIWFRKIDWIAQQGGMVLLNTHPDYILTGRRKTGKWQFPVELYEKLLQYVKANYAGAYWQALPREVAQFVTTTPSTTSRDGASRATAEVATRKPKIWIDLDNTPHVPFFEPIMAELRQRGYSLLVTARDAFQVCDLADKKGVQYIKIGRHYGKNRLLKASGLIYRAIQLAPLVLRERPGLAVSHGARSQLLLGNLLGIPRLLIEDYEFTKFLPLMRPSWVMAPDSIPDEALGLPVDCIHRYPGLKEDVYAWKLEPDGSILKELGISDSELVITVRPPATEAHYHNPESEKLFEAVMERACRVPGSRIVLLPRNKKQGEFIRSHWPQYFENGRTVIPPRAIDGMNLVWHSDLVISGGGTMNREAAALGVPVYSIFRGTIGGVDRRLNAEGRLVLIESVDEVERKIVFARRKRQHVSQVTSRRALLRIVDTIEELARQHC